MKTETNGQKYLYPNKNENQEGLRAKYESAKKGGKRKNSYEVKHQSTVS